VPLSNITTKFSYIFYARLMFSLRAFDECISEYWQEDQGAHGGYFLSATKDFVVHGNHMNFVLYKPTS